MAKAKIVIGLSGGLDSTTLLGHLINCKQYKEIHCCIFDYGATHNLFEINSAYRVIDYYKERTNTKILIHELNIAKVMKNFSSHLLQSNKQKIPEGQYNSESMEKTAVPGRNLIFTSIMAGIAESLGVKEVALAIHNEDHYIYPDCRVEFAKALDILIYLSSDRKVEVLCPFIKMNKFSILRLGLGFEIPTPYHLTRSCYKNQSKSCGKCGTCIERLNAFKQAGIEDLISYE